MTRDHIKLYGTYRTIQGTCLSCGKSTHLLDNCPYVNFIPNSFFIIKRLQFTKSQERNPDFKRRKKRRFNALNNNSLVLNEILQLESSIFSEDDCNNENEEESSSSLKLISSSKLPEIDIHQKNNEKPGFPLNQSYFSESKPIVEIKLPNQQTQEEIILSQKDQNDELEINKEFKYRNSDLKRKTQYNKKVGQNFKMKSSFDKENDKEKKKNENNDMFYYDFERCHTWNFYFPDSNSKKLITKMSSVLKQTMSPHSSSIRVKKRIERKLSKFRIRPNSTDWELFGLEKNLKK